MNNAGQTPLTLATMGMEGGVAGCSEAVRLLKLAQTTFEHAHGMKSLRSTPAGGSGADSDGEECAEDLDYVYEAEGDDDSDSKDDSDE